jgi:putative ABC transport system permease protein
MTEPRRASTRVALAETLRIALDTLRAHKLRSFLTLLGIILAVATLVVVMSVIAGLNSYVSDKVANLGANVFVVNRTGIPTNLDDSIKVERRPYINVDDFHGLASGLRTVTSVAALDSQILDARGGGQLFEQINIVGVTSNYLDLRAYSIAQGRSFNDTDDERRTNVCVLGSQVAQRFFSNSDPIGKTIRIATQEFQVIGVANTVGTVFGQSQDQFVMIPFQTYERIWHTARSSLTLYVQATSPDAIAASEDEVRMLLRARRHVPYDAPDNFGIIGSDSITKLWAQLTGNIFALAVALTSVFMVVGGIVIMNIMLATVTERTHEIGIRKALGARRSHIVMQFLVESAVLAGVGGVIGIALAEIIIWLVRETLSLPVSTPFYSVMISILLSTAVGFFFGIYPALCAAKLDPIEALRAET